MRHTIAEENKKAATGSRLKAQGGFSVLEMLIAVCILIPIMAGAMQLYSVGVNQYASEQSTVEANQDASAGFNMMTREIAQAGSHGDIVTTLQANVAGSATPQTVPVASSVGFSVGDYIEVLDASGNVETVPITGVGDGTITGAFMGNYVSGDPIRLFALPYLGGILPPGTPSPNTATDVTTLRFFGDIYGDGILYYVEYAYDSANAQITRSMTPFTSTAKEPAVPLLTNVKPGSARFTLHTDARSVITSVTVSLTIESQWETASGASEEIKLSSKVTAPSTKAASILLEELLSMGGLNKLPPIPQRIALYTE